MSNPLPRSIIPDTWAAKTRCPICSAAALKVRHLPAAPDQMVCRVCQSAFEVEERGEQLHFTQLAEPLAEILANRWVTMDAVKEAIYSARLAVETRQPTRPAAKVPSSQLPDASASDKQRLEPPSPGSWPTDDEVLAKAQALHKLGNSPDQVATILARNPLITPEQVQDARSALANQDELKAKRQNRIFYLTGGAAILLIILCLVLGFLAQSFKNPFNVNQVTQPLPTEIIRAITPEIIQEPSEGAVAAICPMTRSDAATLFGGEARDWTQKNNAWMYLTTPQATVHVPKGMTALLLLDVNVNTVNLVGPATVKNVFAITIYCH